MPQHLLEEHGFLLLHREHFEQRGGLLLGHRDLLRGVVARGAELALDHAHFAPRRVDHFFPVLDVAERVHELLLRDLLVVAQRVDVVHEAAAPFDLGRPQLADGLSTCCKNSQRQ